MKRSFRARTAGPALPSGLWCWVLLTLGWTGELTPTLQGQQTPPGIIKGAFVFPEYERDKPNQLRSLLTGAGARPQTDGQVLLSTLRWEFYGEGGRTNLVILGTNCLFDARNKLASSPDQLRIQSGDLRFCVEGVGFLWRHSNSVLTVSNRVYTRIEGVGVVAPALTP